jgi:hypothetical protein
MKQRYIIFSIAIFAASVVTIKAQDNKSTVKLDSVYTKVDVLPEFPGGTKALGKYVDGKIIIIQKKQGKTRLKVR